MTTKGFEITLKGASFSDVIAQAKSLVTEAETFGGKTAKVTVVKGGKKSKAAVEEDEDDLADEAANAESDDDLEGMDDEEDAAEEDEEEIGFDDADDEEVEDKKPAKGKAAKGKTIEGKEVQAAAMKHAKKNTRKVTLALLKKHFGVQSVEEIKKQEDRAKALKLLAV